MANVSHEFRTPLHAILGLTAAAARAADGPLTAEQRKQVSFIRTSAEELLALVNDLLDLSKAESGKASLRAAAFAVSELFAALRGMLRPLLPTRPPVELASSTSRRPHLVLETDQGKLAQMLRNLVSNALKFTERGEVRVSGAAADDEQRAAPRSPTPASASRPSTSSASSRSSARSRARCRAQSRARASACRCRASWPSCSAARSRVEQRGRPQARPSP